VDAPKFKSAASNEHCAPHLIMPRIKAWQEITPSLFSGFTGFVLLSEIRNELEELKFLIYSRFIKLS